MPVVRDPQELQVSNEHREPLHHPDRVAMPEAATVFELPVKRGFLGMLDRIVRSTGQDDDVADREARLLLDRINAGLDEAHARADRLLARLN
jgi:hypothetical protein